MEDKPSPKSDVANNASTTTTDRLLESPEIQKAIAQIPDLIREHINAQLTTSKSITKGTILLAGFVIAVVMISVVLLAFWDKLSSDAVSMVIGAVVGATFTFLSRSFFTREE